MLFFLCPFPLLFSICFCCVSLGNFQLFVWGFAWWATIQLGYFSSCDGLIHEHMESNYLSSLMENRGDQNKRENNIFNIYFTANSWGNCTGENGSRVTSHSTETQYFLTTVLHGVWYISEFGATRSCRYPQLRRSQSPLVFEYPGIALWTIHEMTHNDYLQQPEE